MPQAPHRAELLSPAMAARELLCLLALEALLRAGAQALIFPTTLAIQSGLIQDHPVKK